MAKNDLQGALDLLILKTLSQLGEMHGFGIVMHIRRVSDELLIVEEGSLYPALHRMEQNGWLRASWGRYRLWPQSQVVRAYARGQGTVGQPRKELGAGGQRRRRNLAFCVR